MRIERVDDTTVKLFITYSDIELEDSVEKIYGLTVKRRRILLVNDG